MDKFAAMRVFVKIADAGNLSAAGRQLGLSLTSVSRQLMALEGALGTPLLRTGEADSGGSRRGGTRTDDADGSRVRPIACERSIAARSVAVGANAARLSGGADSGLDRSERLTQNDNGMIVAGQYQWISGGDRPTGVVPCR
jgi:Bacterial regulatory helix-turn-helix protein, lysR family